MKKYLLSFLVATVAATGTVYAQSYAPDAYRFSQMNYGSTSRFKAMGSAQIGVGGDIGSIGANPAGLGLFTKSEFSLTPEFNSVKNSSDFLGKSTDGNKSQLNLSNIGVVFYSPAAKAKGSDLNKGLVSSVFGLSYYRNNDFLNNIDYNGTNTNNSIRNSFAEQANDFGIDNAIAGDAYYSGLINHGSTLYPNRYSAEQSTQNAIQNYSESRLGSTSEFSLAGALNFGNKIYVGATLSFVNVKYSSQINYNESGALKYYDEVTKTYDAAPVPYTLNHVTYQDTKGSGVNLKLGIIYRPVSEFRIGLNFQTPTWMNIQENYSEGLNAKLTGFNNNSSNQGVNYPFSYNLSTPLKASAGLSYIIAGTALISADIDYVDYSSMKFSADNGSDASTINNNNTFIKNSYKSTQNYRFGAEIKVSNEISLRAGYGLNGSGVKGGDNNFFAAKTISGGLGYRVSNYYFDLAYQNTNSNFYSSPYDLNDYSEPLATVKNNRNNVFLTFGVRF